MVHYLTRLLILGLFLSISSSADAFQVPTCLGPVRTSGFRAHQIRTMALDADGSQPDLHVAWVGNSFVYYNKLPRMLKCMFKSGGTALQQKEVLVGGQGLHGHSKDENVDKMLAQKEWDVVVLQDQSAVPGGADEKKFSESLTALRAFYAPRLANCRRVVLYSTWGHKEGSPALEHYKDAYPCFEVMNAKVSQGYVTYQQVLKDACPSLEVRSRDSSLSATPTSPTQPPATSSHPSHHRSSPRRHSRARTTRPVSQPSHKPLPHRAPTNALALDRTHPQPLPPPSTHVRKSCT
jgi:hypothetical protein